MNTFTTYAGCYIGLDPFKEKKSWQLKRVLSNINPVSVYSPPIYFSDSKIENLRSEYRNSENQKKILKKLKEYAELDLKDVVPSIQKMALLDYYRLTEDYLFADHQKPEFFICDLNFLLIPIIHFKNQHSFLSWNQGTISLIYDEQRNGHHLGPYELLRYQDLSFDFYYKAIEKLADSIRSNYKKDKVIIAKTQIDFLTRNGDSHKFFQSQTIEDFRQYQILFDDMNSILQRKIETRMVVDFPFLNFFEFNDFSGLKFHYPKIFRDYIKKNITQYTKTNKSLDDRISRVKIIQAKFSKKITKKFFVGLKNKEPFMNNDIIYDIINKFFVSFFQKFQSGEIKKIMNRRQNNGVYLIHPKIQQFRLNSIRKRMSKHQSDLDCLKTNEYFIKELKLLLESNPKKFISIVYNFALMFNLDAQIVFLIFLNLLFGNKFKLNILH